MSGKNMRAMRRGSVSERMRRGLAMVAAGTLATAALISVNVAGASPAMAAPGDPFDPATPTVFVAQSGPAPDTTRLYRAETSGDGTYSFIPEGDRVPAGGYNAVSYRTSDQHLYGAVGNPISSAIPQNSVVRIGESGVVSRVGTQSLPNTQFVGAFGGDGFLYTSNGSSGALPFKQFHRVNVDTGAITPAFVPDISGYSIADMEYFDGFFWALDYNMAQPPGSLLRIDPADGHTVRFPGAVPAALPGAWGAAWKFGNGNLGFSHNATGTILQLRITDPAAAQPGFTVISTVAGPASSGNDGTAIPGLPADLAITKTGPATLVSGERIAYQVTVTNNGEGISSGWTVTDALPAGLSNPTVVGGVLSSTSGNTVSVNGPRLAPGQSTTFTIEADVAVTPPACIVNTASVLGNEADPDLANNEDSADACTRALSIEKTSDATSDSRPGDVVTYTVTATNTGAGAYTVENPAVVFDDLSAVLDDAQYNGDAAASVPGTVGYQEPLISWSGALAVGESVDITYTVTLQGGGDGEVANVGWVPNDPSVTIPPTCDPATGGIDDATGQPCAQEAFELPRLTIDKSVDTDELPAIGEQATFTVVVGNAGPGDYTATAPASATDDLSEVLDDASFDDASLTVDVGTVSRAGDSLEWSGALTAGEQATITYSVTYTGDGDQILRNLACVPEDETLPGAQSCDSVQVPGSLLTQWKSAEASATPVVAGSTITYTLFFANEGQTPVAVDAVDDLTHVLDDAEVAAEPKSPEGLTVARNGGQISISGTVPVGETRTVVYTVTVLPDAERGDSVATNFLLPPGTPPVGPCDPATEQCTVTPIQGFEIEKTSDVDTITPGGVVTYTVTVTNVGAVDYTDADPAAFEDDLSGVLDDAVYNGDVSAGGSVAGTTLAWSGPLAVGATVAVTYSVTVDDPSSGDSLLENVVVPDGPTGACVAGGCATETPVSSYTVSKESDSPTALPGGVVTYTVTLTNTGEVAYTDSDPASFEDDLSGVLDDAAYNDDASDGATVSGSMLTWSGALGVGETMSITYSVTVDDPVTGDFVLQNAVTPDGPGGSCEAVCQTSTPVGSYHVVKSTTATDVVPGDIVTYTVVVTNIGQVAFTTDSPASFTRPVRRDR